MSESQEVKEIEVDMEQAKRALEKRDALRRLMTNADFKAVIGEGYLRDEAVRLVILKGHPQMAGDAAQQADLQADIDAVGRFNGYLSVVMQMGLQAERTLDDGREELESISANDLVEGAAA